MDMPYVCSVPYTHFGVHVTFRNTEQGCQPFRAQISNHKAKNP